MLSELIDLHRRVLCKASLHFLAMTLGDPGVNLLLQLDIGNTVLQFQAEERAGQGRVSSQWRRTYG